METLSFLKNELKPTSVSWISVDDAFGDYLFKSDLFEVRGHAGIALLTNDSDHVAYREWQRHDDEGEPVFEVKLDDETGEPELDDDDEEVLVPVMDGEYFLTLYLQHETDVPRTDENGEVVRDDLGRIVTYKSRKAEIIATDLAPVSEGKQTRVANKFARKLGSVRKYRAKDPRTIKRGRKAKTATIDPADVKAHQVELNGSMWCVIKLGQAEPVARFPGNVDGRESARNRAAELNDAE